MAHVGLGQLIAVTGKHGGGFLHGDARMVIGLRRGEPAIEPVVVEEPVVVDEEDDDEDFAFTFVDPDTEDQSA